MEAGNLDEAYSIFQELGDYKDSADYLERFVVLSDVLLDAVQETTDKLGNTYEYVYDGYKFFLEAEVNAVQTHNAADAIKSAWGVDVNVSADKKISLK